MTQGHVQLASRKLSHMQVLLRTLAGRGGEAAGAGPWLGYSLTRGLRQEAFSVSQSPALNRVGDGDPPSGVEIVRGISSAAWSFLGLGHCRARSSCCLGSLTWDAGGIISYLNSESLTLPPPLSP